MRYATISLLLLLSTGAASAASLTEDQRLALRVMKARGEDYGARAAAVTLVTSIAHGYAAGAPLRDLPVNARALRRAVRLEIKENRPKFVDATVRAYTSVYSRAELGQLVTYYRRSAKKRGKLDPALAGKFVQVAEVRSATIAPLRKTLAEGIFTAYCARKTCDAAEQAAIAAFGHS